MMNKLKQNKGFTLIEMLACVIVVLLLTSVCGLAMNLALQSYKSNVFESDSQMLESTINTYIADVLRHTSSVSVEDDVVKITNNAYMVHRGHIGTLEVAEGDGARLVLYKDEETGSYSLLVGDASYSDGLYIADFTLTYDEVTGVFTGSYTIKSTAVASANKVCNFAYRRIYQNN